MLAKRCNHLSYIVVIGKVLHIFIKGLSIDFLQIVLI